MDPEEVFRQFFGEDFDWAAAGISVPKGKIEGVSFGILDHVPPWVFPVLFALFLWFFLGNSNRQSSGAVPFRCALLSDTRSSSCCHRSPNPA